MFPMFCDGLEHIQEQVVHLFSPGLMEDVVKENQFAQEMGIAQGMEAGFQSEVGRVAIMHESSGELPEDAEVVDGFRAAFGMNSVPGDQAGREVMEPVEFPGDAQAGFIGLGQRRFFKQVFDARFEAGEVVIGGEQCGLKGGLADGLAEEVFGHLDDAIEGEQLLNTQVDPPGVQARTVLSGSGDVFGKISGDVLMGAGAALDLGLMFGDEEVLRRQIKDLSFFESENGFLMHGASASAGATGQPVGDDQVGLVDGFQRVTGMSRLAA